MDNLLRMDVSYLCLGGNDLALTDTLALGGHGEGFLELLAEDDVLDEHALNLDTPPGGHVLNDLANGLGNLLAALNDVLEDARANDVAQRGLGALDEGLADVGDAKGGLVGRDNVVVDDRGEAQGDVVLGHADLFRDLCNLDLNVDLGETLGEGVDLDETRVDGLVEAAKLGDETDVALVDMLVRVGAEDAAWDGTHCTDASANGIDHGAIPALGVCLVANNSSIAALEILRLGGLDGHLIVRLEANGGVCVGCLGGRALSSVDCGHDGR